MRDESVRVIKRDRMYRISDVGKVAIAKFLEPDYVFAVGDVRPEDSVQLTSTVIISGGTPEENGSRHLALEIPASMLEEVT